MVCVMKESLIAVLLFVLGLPALHAASDGFDTASRKAAEEKAPRCGAGSGGVVSDSAVSVRRLIGMRVTNPIREEIGEVSDLVIDQCGRIERIVVHAGGFLGFGGRNVHLSLDQVRIRSSESSEELVVVVRQTREYIMSEENTVSGSGSGH